jgi:hypothetical protein
MYDDDEVKSSIVHARQDIVLLVSHLSSANAQIWTIKVMLLVVLVVLIYIAVKIS